MSSAYWDMIDRRANRSAGSGVEVYLALEHPGESSAWLLEEVHRQSKNGGPDSRSPRTEVPLRRGPPAPAASRSP
jgi:hypothetical protein